MTSRVTYIVVSLCLLAGCKSIEGSYYPGCPSFAGDKVTLSGGRVAWDKFTDQVILDDAGNVVDQSPDYPKEGTYTLDGESLKLSFAGTEKIESMHIVRQDNRLMLLSDEEFAAWKQSGHIDKCVLTREAEKRE